MALSQKEVQELEKKLAKIEELSRKLGDNISTVNLRPVVDNAATIERLFKSLTDEFEELTADISYAVEGFKKITGEVNNFNVGIKETTKGFTNLSSISEKVQYYQKGITELSVKEVQKLQEKQAQEKQRLINASNLLKESIKEKQNNLENLKSESKRRELSAEELKIQEKLTAEIAKEKVALENNRGIIKDQDGLFKGLELTLGRIKKDLLDQDKLLGIGGAAIEGMDKALEELGFGKLGKALGLEDVKDKMKEVAAEIQEAGGDANSFANKFKVLKAGISEAGNNLIKTLKDPLTATLFVVTEMIEAFKDVDKGAGKVAKNFGVSYDSALELKGEMNSIAGTSSDINITTGKLTESFMTLNNAFGTFANLSKETLVTFTKLTKQAGISNEAAIALTQTAIVNNKTTEETTQEYLGQVEAFKAQTGSAINTRLVLEDIAKISKATALTLGNTPEALAEAAATARSLGLSIETVNNAASQLLQFQSSIESELEAELLTGKQLNLEEARRAALDGDIATLSKEIAKNIGTAADFSKMNVLQQEALAKSVGMSREDLAKTLADQEVLTKLKAKEGETAQEAFNRKVKEVGLEKAKKELGDEALANQYAGQNISEKFSATMEKVKEIFISLAEPLLPVLEIFTDIFKIIGPIVGLIGKMVHYLAIAAKYIGTAVAGFYTLKFLGDQTYRTTILTNVARSVGLITEQQAINAKKAQIMLNREDLAGNKVLNIWKGRTLGTTLQQNIAERLGLNTKEKSLGLTIRESAIKAKDFIIDKGKLAIQYALNAAKVIGNTLSKISNAIGLTGLIRGIGSAAMNVVKAFADIPFGLGVPLGIAAALGVIALGYKFLKGNDVVSGGYGKRTLMAPEGAIALNDKDTVIAGTDLGGKNKSKSNEGGGTAAPASSPSIDITPLLEKMAAVEGVLQQILAKETNIYMDSTKVGTGFAVGTSKVQ